MAEEEEVEDGATRTGTNVDLLKANDVNLKYLFLI